ncbi:MAG: alkaline phosphatase family protein [Chloroflexi bacterium]|nr:alkaline phosphatase family protein [Chloroflexota bacterium]
MYNGVACDAIPGVQNSMDTIRRWWAHVATFVLDNFAALTGFYYSKKYTAIIKRLGLRPQAAQDTAESGLIIIQIDGLAYEHLLQAMDHRHMPNIKRMIRRGGFVLSPWRSGLPSTTPAAQAGIMYGDNEGIPAFRWYDKSRGTSMILKQPGAARAVQERLARRKPGILQAGSSYVNLYDGEAASSLFTLSALQPRRIFEGVRGIGFVALFLLNPLRTLRTLSLILGEYLVDSIQRLSSRLKGQSYLPILGIFPFLRIFSNVVFREIETFAVLLDIYRGVPAIYATYYGYDEIAHHFGVDSISAHQALHGIDHCIGQIDRLRRAKPNRAYTLCILSDHGMTPAEPFSARYGETLGQFIVQQIGTTVFLGEHDDEEHEPMSQMRMLLGEWKAAEKNLAPAASRMARRLRLLVQRRLRSSNPLPKWDAQRRQDVVVKNSGSLAHVYFNVTGHRMDLSDIAAAFPELVLKLLAHAGVWLVAASEGEQTIIMAEDGMLTCGPQGQFHLSGENPLRRLSDPQHAAEQISRLVAFEQSGDLVLFGDYDPTSDVVVCFEQQQASHGGLGGPQDHPFIIYPRRLGWDLSKIRDSRDLYPLFAAQRGLLSEEEREDEI